MSRIMVSSIFAALLIAATAPFVNAAETHNLRQDAQMLGLAGATSGDAADPGFRAALGLSGDEGLEVLRTYADGRGGTVTRYRQTYRGVPVWGEQIVIGRDASGRVRSLHGRVVQGLATGLQQLRPSLSSADALQAMKDRVAAGFPDTDEVVFKNERSDLVIYLDGATPRLSQAVSFFADAVGGGKPTRPTFIVDAVGGGIVFQYEGLTHNDCGGDCMPDSTLSDRNRRWQYFEFTVLDPPGGDVVEISISGGSGDADLYIRKGQPPTLSIYACRPFLAGNNETCTVPATADDVWHIGIYGYRRYSGVDLRAEVKSSAFEDGTPVAGTGPGGNEKIGEHYYDGTDPNFLDVFDVVGDGSACTMDNVNVKTVDLNHGLSGSTAFAYTCPENRRKFINGAYSPLNDAHFFGGVVYDMYQNYVGEPPLTFQLTMRVHYRNNYENAFWDGASMTFGDGYSRFYPLVSLDVSAHEVSHGFTEQNSGLIYSGQSGGINEAFSDMAGEAAEFFMRGSNDFLVGWEIFKAEEEALRYMCNPPQDGRSIDNVAAYSGGMNVHYSSGVFNKAFCMLVTADNGWDTRMAFKAFAGANQMYWTPSTNFAEGAQSVVDAAYDLLFDASDVVAAFAVVGIEGLVLPGTPTNQPPTADAGSDQTVTDTDGGGFESVTLDGTGSTDDGGIVNYVWTEDGGGVISTDVSPTISLSVAGSPHTITLEVTDGEGLTDTDDVVITVQAPVVGGSDPVVSGCDPGSGNTSQRLTVTVAGSGFVDGATVDFGTRIAVQGVTWLDAGELSVRIRVHNRAASGSRDVTVTNPDGGQGTGASCFAVN